jgi:hypothetical protein
MTIEQRLKIMTITAGVLGLAAIVSWVGLFLIRNRNKAQIESPILASGGSMTFRAYRPWTCAAPVGNTPSIACVALANVTSFGSAGVENLMSTTPAPNQGPGIGNGTVVFHMRDRMGGLSSSGVSVTLCMSQSAMPGGACATSNITTVQIKVTNPSGSSAGLVTSYAVEPADAHTSATYALQYFDPACPVHGTSAYPIPPNNIPACEHPGYVDWPDSSQYRCRSGTCWVFLTP